jgi:8-oxo-dGTP pyrophosphatase MutT (NUDIX family)
MSSTGIELPRAFPPVISQYSGDKLVVGGGVAIFHIATSRVVICSDVHRGKKYYFLPKGRRDAGEESGTGAEREGYEEVGVHRNYSSVGCQLTHISQSGYRNRRLPLPTQHRQPEAHPRVDSPPLTAEPVWMQLMPIGTRGSQYVLYWYIAETLPPDLETELMTEAGATYKPPPPFPKDLTILDRINLEPEGYEPLHHENTGVDEDEKRYESYLVSAEEAITKLGRNSVMADVVRQGWDGIQNRIAIENAATSTSPEAMA